LRPWIAMITTLDEHNSPEYFPNFQKFQKLSKFDYFGYFEIQKGFKPTCHIDFGR